MFLLYTAFNSAAFLAGYFMSPGAEHYSPGLVKIVRFTVTNGLEFLRIVLTWPVAVGILGIVFMYFFREPISYFIREKLKRLKAGAGGVELQAEQIRSDSEVEEREPSDEEAEKIIRTLVQELAEKTQEKLQMIEAQEGLRKRIFQIFEVKNKQSRYWYFNYLNVFFVPNTKASLRFVAQTETPVIPQTLQLYLSTFGIVEPDQPGIILNVLEQNQLIASTPTGYKITENGQRYIDFMDGKQDY